ncbi:MAG TPA: arginine deiminase-related protein [Gemmatimonadota bacterium]|nr:arginine deiminase-related protein [Gemmatimonadota bacterium]
MAARRVLMVDPLGFRSNPETIEDNAFQGARVEPDPARVETAARAEFQGLRDALLANGVEVHVHVPINASTPDAVFPNNWFTTSPDGTLVLYPMRAHNRRGERWPTLVKWLGERYPTIVDLTGSETGGAFLEGTGSLVIDEPARIVYASVSSRTDPRLVSEWADRFGYAPHLFRAAGRDGREVYHTNVVMGLGDGWAVVCGEAIRSPEDRARIEESLARTDHEVVQITVDQMHDFCGNVLGLENSKGERFIVMSERARRAFRPDQLAALSRHAEPLYVDLTTIETHGGGSARCMLAELH